MKGDFESCAEGLFNDKGSASAALRVRAKSRLGDFDSVVCEVDSLMSERLSHPYAAELLSMKAFALISKRDPNVDLALTEARVRAFSSGESPVECEVLYAAALSAWVAGNRASAKSLAAEILELDTVPSPFAGPPRTDYIYDCAYWRARAFDLLGMLDAGQEDYAAQARAIANGFVEFDRSTVNDIFAEAHMLGNLAVLIRELDDEVLAEYVELRVAELTWNEHCSVAEFNVYRSIGWNRAKRGDYLAAYRHFRRSAQCTQSIPLQIAAILDRAFIAGELGETFTAQDDLEYAVRLGKQTDWKLVPSAEVDVLHDLAQNIAPFDVQQARKFWDRFVALKPSMSVLDVSLRGDRREIAKEHVAHAAVLRAEGQKNRAATLLFDAFDIFSEVGYASRAASVAVDLYDMTGESKFFEVASREARKRPQSWIARRVAGMRELATV